jgi:hypothetical protein
LKILEFSFILISSFPKSNVSIFLLGPLLDNTEVYLTHFISTQKTHNCRIHFIILFSFQISNKYLTESTLQIKQSYNKSVPPEIIKVFSHVGYGDDTNNGYTVDLLRIISSAIGQISSFHGRTYSSEWHLNL